MDDMVGGALKRWWWVANWRASSRRIRRLFQRFLLAVLVLIIKVMWMMVRHPLTYVLARLLLLPLPYVDAEEIARET